MLLSVNMHSLSLHYFTFLHARPQVISVRADPTGGRRAQILVWSVCSAGAGTVFAGDSQGRTHVTSRHPPPFHPLL